MAHQEYTRVPTTEDVAEDTKAHAKSLEAGAAAPQIVYAGHVCPAQKRCKGRRFLFALFLGAMMTFLTVGTIRMVTHGGCPFKHRSPVAHDGHFAAQQPVLQDQSMHSAVQAPLVQPQTTHAEKAEMDMIVLNDPAHPIPDVAVQALASAKLRALKAAGYNVSEVNVAVIPQDKKHPYTLKQAMEVGLKAIDKAKALAKGMDMKMKMMAERMREGLKGAKGVFDNLFNELKAAH